MVGYLEEDKMALLRYATIVQSRYDKRRKNGTHKTSQESNRVSGPSALRIRRGAINLNA